MGTDVCCEDREYVGTLGISTQCCCEPETALKKLKCQLHTKKQSTEGGNFVIVVLGLEGRCR